MNNFGKFDLPGNNFRQTAISDTEFEAIKKLVYDNFGINLTEQKRSLVVGRLQKFLRTKKISSFSEYIDYVRREPSGQAMGELINRISTNHTFFFRENEHFEFIKKTILPEAMTRLNNRKARDLRIWCAGCSYGDEPYTIVMTMMEHFGVNYRNWDAGLLATDISAAALAGARAGVYTEDRVKLVPDYLKKKYFTKLADGSFQVNEILKKEITFRRFNLMNKQMVFKKKFDLISCRNVMIYFDQKTRNSLVKRFYDLTVPGGYLFIGHSETLRNDECPYEYVKPAIYRKGGA